MSLPEAVPRGGPHVGYAWLANDRANSFAKGLKDPTGKEFGGWSGVKYKIIEHVVAEQSVVTQRTGSKKEIAILSAEPT